jgi:hypothetical protein
VFQRETTPLERASVTDTILYMYIGASSWMGPMKTQLTGATAYYL